jgi:hypothetical protein
MNILQNYTIRTLAAIIIASIAGCAALQQAPTNPSASATMQTNQLLPPDCPSVIVHQARSNCANHAAQTASQARSGNIRNELALGAGGTALGAGAGALSGSRGYDYYGYYGRHYRGYDTTGRNAAIGAGLGLVAGAVASQFANTNTQGAYDAAYISCFADYAVQCNDLREQQRKAAEATYDTYRRHHAPAKKRSSRKHAGPQ